MYELRDPGIQLPEHTARLRGGHVESYFLKANEPEGPRALWIKFTVLVPLQGEPLAEVWAIVFDARSGRHLARKRSFPLAAARLARGRIGFAAGGCRLEDGYTEGVLAEPAPAAASPGAQGAGAPAPAPPPLRWALRWRAGAPPLRLLPYEPLYRWGAFPRTKSLTPYPDARLWGWIEIGSRRIAVADWPGCLGHNWGREHAPRYAWAHCNAFAASPGSWFEGASAQLQLGPLTLPYATVLYLHHAGRAYDFRGVRHWFRTAAEVELYRWRFRARSAEAELEGEVACEPRALVGLRYQQPDGRTSYCLNSKIARMRLRLRAPDGRLLAALDSADKAALELLVREPEHGVPLYC
ncbi:MAG: hypothetical protein KatS3mg102_1378 [Planctomycetota bacterium]|nr:MAG: hypothetical protein KatS3mg102_1378 [Planctomycetota bacterium]